MSGAEIVDTPAEARRLEMPPLLIRQPLARFLDEHGIGSGPIRARRIGEGQSNVTYLVERDGARLVLRRPPRPPLPPSTHDVLREAAVQTALGRAGARVPTVLLVCDDPGVLGVPFYLMEPLEGLVLTEDLPDALAGPAERRRIGLELVDALVEIHAVDWVGSGLQDFGRPDGYLQRQVRRFAQLWEINATRDLPDVARLTSWLDSHRPVSPAPTVVHGDYRLGNVFFAPWAPARVLAVLDWELSTIGDPFADVGYLLATYSEPGSTWHPMALSPVTKLDGFPTREQLRDRYEQGSGRAPGHLDWYEALALWKAAIFCEAIYGRWRRGERPSDDPWAGRLDVGVPRLLDIARERAGLSRFQTAGAARRCP